jgi:hypothetical protein
MAIQERKVGLSRGINNVTAKGRMAVDLGKLVGVGGKEINKSGVLGGILSSAPEAIIKQKGWGEVASGNEMITVTFGNGRSKVLEQSVIKNTKNYTTVESSAPSVIEQIVIASLEMGAKPIEIDQKSSTDNDCEVLPEGTFVNRKFDLEDFDNWKVVVDKAQALGPLFKGKSGYQSGEVLKFIDGFTPKGVIYKVK